MKPGDIVRVLKAPEGLRESSDDLTRTLFDLSVGETFPIAAINDNLIELHVGQVLGEDADLHTIYIGPECVELVD